MITNRTNIFWKRLVLCALLTVLCLLFPLKGLAFSVTEKTGFVEATTGVNVRSGPGKEYDALGTMQQGEQLPVTGITDNDWFEVKFRGEKGYVYASYVKELSGESKEGKASEEIETSAAEGETEAQAAEEEVTGLTLPILGITVPWLTQTLLFVLAGIVIILIVIISTIASFKRDEDDEEDDDEDDEEDDTSPASYRRDREDFSKEEYEAALRAANQKIAALQREIDYLKRSRR
ncbi:MAG: SH3 domain-containing protein [Lachnospiraceae bacterium]|nr:SH3 domain-containing protein [Lachnospiraceae bacterium]